MEPMEPRDKPPKLPILVVMLFPATCAHRAMVETEVVIPVENYHAPALKGLLWLHTFQYRRYLN